MPVAGDHQSLLVSGRCNVLEPHRLGRRDHALLTLAMQTGLRVSELTGLRVHDLHLGPGAHVRCHGKGRKNRITPLTRPTVTVLRAWLSELAGQPDDVLFPTRRYEPLSRDAVERLRLQAARLAPAIAEGLEKE
jgi:site-specific recombinase XerC